MLSGGILTLWAGRPGRPSGFLTFTAMIRPLGTCLILSTTPYAPRPSSQICSRSSAFTSKFCSGYKHKRQEQVGRLLPSVISARTARRKEAFKSPSQIQIFRPTQAERKQPPLPMENSTYLMSLK